LAGEKRNRNFNTGSKGENLCRGTTAGTSFIGGGGKLNSGPATRKTITHGGCSFGENLDSHVRDGKEVCGVILLIVVKKNIKGKRDSFVYS